MAELLAAIGEWDRAETLYRDLAREDPLNALAPAALGTIALKRGDREARGGHGNGPSTWE